MTMIEFNVRLSRFFRCLPEGTEFDLDDLQNPGRPSASFSSLKHFFSRLTSAHCALMLCDDVSINLRLALTITL